MMDHDDLDKRLKPLFSQATLPLPAALRAQLLDIPAQETALAARWMRWLVPAVAAGALVIIGSRFGGQLLEFARHLIGGRFVHALSSASYRLYSVIMEQWAPWQETLPLGYAGPVIVLLGTILLVAAWMGSRPATGGLLAPVRAV